MKSGLEKNKNVLLYKHACAFNKLDYQQIGLSKNHDRTFKRHLHVVLILETSLSRARQTCPPRPDLRTKHLGVVRSFVVARASSPHDLINTVDRASEARCGYSLAPCGMDALQIAPFQLPTTGSTCSQ